MLKIKSNVDLKELEKYGKVKKRYSNLDGKLTKIDMYGNGWHSIFSALRFKKRKKRLIFRRRLENDNSISLVLCTYVKNYDTDYSYERVQSFDADLLYDLIKADLVEKVDYK